MRFGIHSAIHAALAVGYQAFQIHIARPYVTIMVTVKSAGGERQGAEHRPIPLFDAEFQIR
jgi:hypothetical protein